MAIYLSTYCDESKDYWIGKFECAADAIATLQSCLKNGRLACISNNEDSAIEAVRTMTQTSIKPHLN